MKICSDCNIGMVEDAELHTDYVGGVRFEEQIFVSYEGTESNGLFGESNTKRVKARVCPKCGKVELYVNFNEDE